MRVALLLRGVHVGGVTVRSAELRGLLARAGLRHEQRWDPLAGTSSGGFHRCS